MAPTIALVDCNNFYASCERLFRPDLKLRPVIVLSNNDGCLIAQSRESKALGLKMGTPYFQLRDMIRQHDIAVFSSNYALYGDLSFRVMQTLENLAPAVEIYSIDEAFLDLSGTRHVRAPAEYGRHIKQTVEQHTGIPVCVGIGPTKTLAKLANRAAKTYPATGGVVDLSDPQRQRKLMALIPVHKVWGIGQRLGARLAQQGITTARDLSRLQPALARRQYSVVLERTVRELNGETCLDLEQHAPPKKQIIASRSFSQRITDYQRMRQAIACYVARAAEKLRREKQYARVVSVFILGDRQQDGKTGYARSVSAELPFPSADTRDLGKLAQSLLLQIWRAGPSYYKAGVMLSDFHAPGTIQYSLFEQQQPRRNSEQLMATIDRLNRHDRNRLIFAAQGINPDWQMKRRLLSPAYTTRWGEIPRIS